jgi:catechol 2,3-dioxygenase
MTPEKKPAQLIDPQVRMGHVHLKVADLERAIGFYRDVYLFRSWLW